MTDQDKKSVAVYEEITKDLATREEKKVPLSTVFGHGSLGNLQSFGGKSLQENSKDVDEALSNVGELEDIWNHAHTQWAWKHINFSWHSPMQNMRQISAEIAAKKNALNAAKWDYVQTEIKLRKLQEELEKPEELTYWEEIEKKVELAKTQESLADGSKYIEGAMKDVLAINKLYEQLKSRLNDFNEYDVELEESKSHLKRSLVQCIRDVRQCNFITKGEQEYMEQIGVNPMKIQKLIREYVASEEQAEDWGVSQLHDFVDQVTDELIGLHQVDKKVMNIIGFDDQPFEEFSFTKKLAKPSDE